MPGLATPEDPEPAISALQASSHGTENPAQGAEPTPSSHLVPDPAPPILYPSNPLAQSSNDMQVDKMKVPPITILSPDQTPVGEDPPLSNLTPSAAKFNERPPPLSEPPQPPLGIL